jgi:CubicO group peptidase (beta-lactamase class C family)
MRAVRRTATSRTLPAIWLLAAGCYPAAAPDALSDGVWWGGAGSDELVFEFRTSMVGAHPIVHVMREGRKVAEVPVRRTRLDLPRLEIWAENGHHFRGRVDLDRMRIDGELTDLTGRPRSLRLERFTRAEVPGFLARPPADPGSVETRLRSPPAIDDGWPIARPEAVGIDPAGVEALVAAVVAGEAGEIHSLLVARQGKLVVEEYFHGHRRDDLQPIDGCTKSVTSLLVGIAIDGGRIEGVSAPVLDFFPEQRSRAEAGWDRVSLEHLLTMSVGRTADQWQATGAIEAAETPYHFVLTSKVTGGHGDRWRYGDRDVNLLAGVLRHATGRHADAFAAAHLFQPLEIDRYAWDDGRKEGFPMLHGGLRLRARDLAKLGVLVLEEGRWGGRRIVSAEWIRASTSARLPASPPLGGYGYLWWTGFLNARGAEAVPVIFASGRGGQFVYVLPSLDVVIALTAGNRFNGKERDHRRALGEHLLPAVHPVEGLSRGVPRGSIGDRGRAYARPADPWTTGPFSR